MPEKTEVIPILPLSDALLFPRMVLPLYVVEERYQRLIADAKEGQKQIGIVYGRPGTEEEVKRGSVCCIGRITYSEEAEQNILDEIAEELPEEGKPLVLTGKVRALVQEVVQVEPYVKVKVSHIKETITDKRFYKECPHFMKELLLRFLFLRHVSDKEIHLANLLTDPGHIADFVAFYFINDMYEKQRFLEMTDVSARCKQIVRLLQGAITELQEQQKGPKSL